MHHVDQEYEEYLINDIWETMYTLIEQNIDEDGNISIDVSYKLYDIMDGVPFEYRAEVYDRLETRLAANGIDIEVS